MLSWLLMDSDQRRETNKIMFVLLAIVLFIASLVGSCNEIRYAVGGKEADASVRSMQVMTHRSRRNSYPMLHVGYTIADGGNQRQEEDEVSPDWAKENAHVFGDEPQTVRVQYLPGSPGYSRIVGHSKQWVIIPFVLATGFIIFVSVRFIREFNAHQRRMEAQR